VLERQNQWLSEMNQAVKQDIAMVSHCWLKVNTDLMSLELRLARLKEEIKPTRLTLDPLAPPEADVAISPTPGSLAPAKPAHLHV
jgi:hypothetical protein